MNRQAVFSTAKYLHSKELIPVSCFENCMYIGNVHIIPHKLYRGSCSFIFAVSSSNFVNSRMLTCRLTPSHKNVLITLQGINPGNYTSGSKSVSLKSLILTHYTFLSHTKFRQNITKKSCVSTFLD